MYNSKAEGSHKFSLPENPDICKQVTETGETYLNTNQLTLYGFTPGMSVKLALFCRSDETKASKLWKEHLLDQVILDFSGQIPFLKITLHDEKLIEQSQQARREAVKQITERRLLKRKQSRHLGRILREYPNIGWTVRNLRKKWCGC